MSRPILALLLGLCAALASCVLAAVGAGAAWVSQEFTDNATLAFVHEEPDQVWQSAKQTMQRRSLDRVEIDEELRALRANVDGATVTVKVQRFDATQTKIGVSAKKWGFYDADEANTVITLIKRDLAR